MLGKTNIVYVTKDQGSDMQFVAETIVTRSSSNIVKIKYFNGIFFAFTNENHVLWGKDIMNLNFLFRGEILLSASDMEFFDGKYIFINANEIYNTTSSNEIPYYISEDLSIFETLKITGIYRNFTKIVGIAVNSYNQLTFLVSSGAEYTYTNSGTVNAGWTTYVNFYVYTCEEVSEESILNVQKSSDLYRIGKYYNKSVFMRDRFFLYSNISEADDRTSYCYCVTLDAVVREVSGSQYPVGIIDSIAYTSIDTNSYYTLNFENYMKVRSKPTTCCIPMGGRIGLYNEGILELATKVNDFSAGQSTELEITGIDYEVLCFAETSEYTYLGCQGGIIIQCLLDMDGTYKTPEITLVKTLAVKEALEKAKEYTDEQVTELKAYVDNILQ